MSATRASAKAARRRRTFRRTTKPDDPQNRLAALLVLFVVIGAGFVAVLVDLQTVRPDEYRSLGEDQRIRERALAGYRGAVVDRNGLVLAASTPSHQIVADPKMVIEPSTTAALLAPILGVDLATLTELLTPSSDDDRFSLLARNVDDEAVTRIQQLEPIDDVDPVLGIFIRPEEDRVYPAGRLATAVVGRVDPDEQGIFGIEAQFDLEMTGRPGTEWVEQGRFGSISVGDWRVDPATAGDDVVLTLDNRIQYMAEQTLIAHCEATGAEGLTAVGSDPQTGEILVMASVVRNDHNECVVAGYNTALVDSFELGSVMKPLVIAAAVEVNGFTADSLVEVPTRISIGGKSFADHPPRAAAPYPITQVLSQSMNVGTIVLSQQLGTDVLYNYLRAFGLGQPTGLDVPGEATGVLRHPDDWYGADYGSIPIGQGVTMNATQLMAAYNVLANGGAYIAPTLVREIESADGVASPVAGQEPTPVFDPRTTDEITHALVAVVDTGTGRRAAIDGYRIAGKTGTAWKVFDNGSGTPSYGTPGNRRYVVSFVGFLPADDPKLSMAIVVDEPDGDVTASMIAAPIFAEIAEYAVRVMAIPPSAGPVGDAEAGERVRAEPAAGTVPAPATGTGTDSVAGEEPDEDEAAG